MADAPISFLLQQIGNHALFRIGEHRHAVLAEIVEQIKVKMVSSAFFQLLLKNLLGRSASSKG